MKKFIIQVVLFALITGAIAWGICPPGKLDDNAHLASIMDKNRLLRAESEQQPRIIFLGGSSVATSNNSKMIASALGYKPVNMGLNAGLGLDYIINAPLPNIRKGDLVVLSLEYQLFTDTGRDGNYDFIQDVMLYDQTSMIEMSPRQVQNLLDMSVYRYMKQFQDKIKQYRRVRKLKKKDLQGQSWFDKLLEVRSAKMYAGDAPYTRDSFDEVGDMIGHLGLPRTLADNIVVYSGPVSPAQWQRSLDIIEEFARHCRRQGADVVFFLTMIPEYNYKEMPEVFDSFAKYFKEHSSVELLNRPDESLLTDDHFFDTPYHLNAAGREVRSSLLLKKLEEYLHRKNKSAKK